jgi:hypothetical protein
MEWWRRLKIGQRFLLGVLIICLLGQVGSLIWGWTSLPFVIVGGIAVIINFIWIVRAGLRAPVPGREDL